MSSASENTAVRTGAITRTFIYIVLLVFALFYLLPFFVMLVNSLKPLEILPHGAPSTARTLAL